VYYLFCIFPGRLYSKKFKKHHFAKFSPRVSPARISLSIFQGNYFQNMRFVFSASAPAPGLHFISRNPGTFRDLAKKAGARREKRCMRAADEMTFAPG